VRNDVPSLFSRLKPPTTGVRRTLHSAVEWLRAGYPDAAPRTGHCALIALHGPQSLSNHQINEVIDHLAAHPGTPTDIDIQTAITTVTDKLPNPSQVTQIRRKDSR
jgi:hypothetical protein